MSEFTKGPWRIWDQVEVIELCGERIRTVEIISKHSAAWLAKVMVRPGATDEEGKANAHLIAAAPEMYEALKAIYQDAIDRSTEVPNPIFHAASDAIAKAEGK